MFKDLVERQRNCRATCVLIETKDIKELSPIVKMKASVSDAFLYTGKRPPFADKIDKISSSEICYFVITGIDEISKEAQERYVGLVKDREFRGYNLPKNCIVVFTIRGRESIKDISPELYHFSVVAF